MFDNHGEGNSFLEGVKEIILMYYFYLGMFCAIYTAYVMIKGFPQIKREELLPND